MLYNRKQLLEDLNKAAPGLADKEIIEQSTSFVFIDGYIVTFNDEIAVSFKSPFGTDVEGAVPAKELLGFLDKIEDKEIDVHTTKKELCIKGKGKKIELAIVKDIELPLSEIINFNPDEVEWIDLAIDTMEAIEFCKFSVSPHTIKPVLNSLHLNGDVVESCDNYRITRFFLDKPTFLDPILIQANNIKILPNYPELTKYAAYDGWAHFSDDKNNIVVSCRLLEEKFPKVGNFITEGKIKIDFPDGLDKSLRAAEIVLDRSTIDNEKVTISLKKDELILQSKGPNGKYTEHVKYKNNKNKKYVTFNIHPTFLRQILKLMNSARLNTNANIINFSGEKFVHVMSLIN